MGVDRLVFLFGCKVGSIPISYFVLPLAAIHNSCVVCDL